MGHRITRAVCGFGHMPDCMCRICRTVKGGHVIALQPGESNVPKLAPGVKGIDDAGTTGTWTDLRQGEASGE